MDKIKTRIYKHRNSQAITLHKSILKSAKINIDDEVICYVENERIIIEKHSPDLQKHWENGLIYDEKEYYWDKPVGREL